MANEIKTQIITSVINPVTPSATAAQLRGAFNEGIFQLTQTTKAVYIDIITVGFGAEQDIVFPAGSKMTAALQGIFCAINLDATNFVTLGPKTAGVMAAMVRLEPRIPQQVRIAPSVVLRWIADTAACDVKVVWFAK